MLVDLKTRTKQFIIDRAQALGFSQIGFSKVQKLEGPAKELENWLHKGYHGEMSYMEHHFDKRIDPGELVPGAKTVLSFSYNYFTEKSQEDPVAPQISMYAYGRDYHKVVKNKLKELWTQMEEEVGSFSGRMFVDSAPVMEREWAKMSGLGWIGKNTLLIHPRKGSYFFLAEMIIDLELEPDQVMHDYCGTCTRCIDACPTDAIPESGYLVDASKCISYLTIELKNNIPNEFKDQMENWMFGCDICQQVCPWNRFSTKHQEPDFEPSDQLLNMAKSEWEELSEEVFTEIFKGSPVKRTKYEGLRRNIEFLNKLN